MLSEIKTLLHSNGAINSIKDMFSGVPKAGSNFKAQDIAEKLATNEKFRKNAGVTLKDNQLYSSKGEKLSFDNEGNMQNLSFMNRLRLAHMNADGSFNETRIAGSSLMGYAGASSAYRVASGGGIYKDNEGNTDLIGLPFI